MRPVAYRDGETCLHAEHASPLGEQQSMLTGNGLTMPRSRPDGIDEFAERLGKVDLRCRVIETEIGERIVDLVDVDASSQRATVAVWIP